MSEFERWAVADSWNWYAEDESLLASQVYRALVSLSAVIL